MWEDHRLRHNTSVSLQLSLQREWLCKMRLSGLTHFVCHACTMQSNDHAY